MKIIKDSMKNHWAIGRQATCSRCETVVEFESLEDFRTIYGSTRVNYECPRCHYKQDFYKEPKISLKDQPQVWRETMPNPNINTFLGVSNGLDMSI